MLADAAPATERLGIAFLGAGIVAELHARAVLERSDASLRGVFDPDRGKVDQLVGRRGGRAYQSVAEALADESVQLVCVLTPPRTHLELSRAALRAGKHVIVEKPVAETRAELQELAQVARECGRVCVPCHNYIHVPTLQTARTLLRAGRLGKLTSFWVLYNIYHSEPLAKIYGGVLRAVCIHHIYSMLYFMGRPLAVSATSSRARNQSLPFEDQVMLTCSFADGALANLWCSFAADDLSAPKWTVTYKLLGTEGSLTYDWNEVALAEQRSPGSHLPAYEKSFAEVLRHVVERCIGLGEPPLSSVHDALDALIIIEAAERSLSEGRRVQLDFGGVEQHL